ncbi:MAG: metallophosphoesterase [Gammaproteobacteria bacterium]|nr:metallophosphoesterase [Gammaproteobacteria bacterium]
MKPPLRVLHITDTHLRATAGATLLGVDTAASLDAVLRQALAEHEPDAVLASGDLAHDPEPAAYELFAGLLREHFSGPVLHLPGNHDLSAPFARLFGARDAIGAGAWEIVGFDSHADYRPEASFDSAARQALAERIRSSRAAHILLACHHPPMPVGCPWLDKDCIPEGLELLESCAAAGRRPDAADTRVRGLVFGHVHQQVDERVGGLRVLGSPSTCFQFEPGSSGFAIDRAGERGLPGYRWLILHPDGELHTEVRRLSGYSLNLDMSDRS